MSTTRAAEWSGLGADPPNAAAFCTCSITNGDRTRAAEILGADRHTLSRMAERMGIDLKERRMVVKTGRRGEGASPRRPEQRSVPPSPTSPATRVVPEAEPVRAPTSAPGSEAGHWFHQVPASPS